ncbi:MAG: hypothetical protein VB862_07895, partial [Pirellulaceae bacterium]
MLFDISSVVAVAFHDTRERQQGGQKVVKFELFSAWKCRQLPMNRSQRRLVDLKVGTFFGDI